MRKGRFCATLGVEFGIKRCLKAERLAKALFSSLDFSRLPGFPEHFWGLLHLEASLLFVKSPCLTTSGDLKRRFCYQRLEFGDTFVSLLPDPTWGPGDELRVAEWEKLWTRLLKAQRFASKPLRSSPNATSSGGNGSERHGEAAGRFFKPSKNAAWAYEGPPLTGYPIST